MKKTLLLSLLLLSTIFVHSQTISIQGSSTIAVTNRGGFTIDSVLRIPIRAASTTIYPLISHIGRLQLNRLDSTLIYHNGTTWKTLVDINKLNTSIPTNNNQLANGANYITLSSLTWSNITGKPSFFSGSYTDLTNIPSIFPSNIPNVSGLQSVLDNKINIGATIPYSTLSGTPNIPAAQINSDWTATSGLSVILNKPVLGTAASQNSTAFATALQGNKADSALQPTGDGSGLINLNKSQVGLGNVPNIDATNPVNTVQTSSYRYVTDTEKTTWNNKQNTLISGTNIKTVDGQSLLGSGNISIPTYTAGTGINVTSNVITNTAPDQTVTLTGGNRINITGTYPNFTIAYIEPTINIVTRSFNSNFTISSTRQAFVTYSVTCQVTNPLLAGSSTANVFLEYSTNGGSTWLLPSQNGNSSSVALAVAIAITNGQTVTIGGTIPANALVRLRTTTTGTASVTYVTGQETY